MVPTVLLLSALLKQAVPEQGRELGLPRVLGDDLLQEREEALRVDLCFFERFFERLANVLASFERPVLGCIDAKFASTY